MIRKSKVLGLAFVAVLAMGAVWASAAQATPDLGVSAGETEVTATGENIGEKFVVAGSSGPVTTECEISHYTGTAVNGSSTLRVTPTYTNCTLGGIGVHIETTGCHYLFHATAKAGADNYKANVDVECTTTTEPEHVQHKIRIYSTAVSCEVQVGSQTGLATVDITDDTEAGRITIKPTLTATKQQEEEGKEMDGTNGPIAYTVVKDGFLCPLNGTGAKTGGEYSSTGYIEGKAASGSIEVTGE